MYNTNLSDNNHFYENCITSLDPFNLESVGISDFYTSLIMSALLSKIFIKINSKIYNTNIKIQLITLLQYIFIVCFKYVSIYYCITKNIKCALLYLLTSLIDISICSVVFRKKSQSIIMSILLFLSIIYTLHIDANVQLIYECGINNYTKIIGYRIMSKYDFEEFYEYDHHNITRVNGLINHGIILKFSQKEGIFRLDVFEHGKILRDLDYFDIITELDGTLMKFNYQVCSIKYFESTDISLHYIIQCINEFFDFNTNKYKSMREIILFMLAILSIIVGLTFKYVKNMVIKKIKIKNHINQLCIQINGRIIKFSEININGEMYGLDQKEYMDFDNFEYKENEKYKYEETLEMIEIINSIRENYADKLKQEQSNLYLTPLMVVGMKIVENIKDNTEKLYDTDGSYLVNLQVNNSFIEFSNQLNSDEKQKRDLQQFILIYANLMIHYHKNKYPNRNKNLQFIKPKI